MSDPTQGKAILENAYLLTTPEDNIRYYQAFAPTYDTDFAQGLGWHYPQAVAGIYRREATGEDVPVADIGCGTGYVAEKLGLPTDQIDGFDISPDMLAIAGPKALYRALHQVDLTGPLTAIPQNYGAVLSAGTFTHGHLGPDTLENLLRIARSGALFVIGVNLVHFHTRGFATLLDDLHSTGKISASQTDEIRMYSKEGHDHSEDRALVVQFRKR